MTCIYSKIIFNKTQSSFIRTEVLKKIYFIPIQNETLINTRIQFDDELQNIGINYEELFGSKLNLTELGEKMPFLKKFIKSECFDEFFPNSI